MNKASVFLLSSIIMTGILLSLILAFPSDARAEATRYVKAGGAGDGTSWATASGTLQAMIDAGEVAGGGTICVAAGTYTPTIEIDGVGPRFRSFQMRSNVRIYGGFPNTGSPSWVDRNWELYKTVCSGEIGNAGTKADNCYHVFNNFMVNNYNDLTTLDGFFITGGNADDEKQRGGGMFNEFSDPTIINCTFLENSAVYGGGMFNWDSDPSLINCTFYGNSAEWDGGGIHNGNSDATMAECVFQHNSAHEGGGIYNDDSSINLVNCEFICNSGSRSGGGIYNDDSWGIITNCTFTGNSANGNEGVYWGEGGGMFNKYSFALIINSTFNNNSADYGGGMSIYSVQFPLSLALVNCTFYKNSANLNGGGIYNQEHSTPHIINSILWGNTAVQAGNQIYDDPTSLFDATYCNIEGGFTGSGNIDMDPMFVSPGSGDFHLLPDSPCINAGSNSAPNLPAEDFEGDPRISNGIVDMGVDESHYTSPLVTTGSVTDITGSSAVLHGNLDNMGNAGTVTVSFEYGNNQGGPYPYISGSQKMSGPGGFSQTIDHLNNGVTYYYRAKVIGGGADWGKEKQFSIVSIPECWYVHSGAGPGGDGASWAQAFNNLHEALDCACILDEIWVAAGTYTPARPGEPGTRSDSFRMKNGVEIYGGFPNTGNPGWEDRDWNSHKTFLSGEIGNPGTKADNCYHVFYHPEGLALDNTAILDGFVIADGYADGYTDPADKGGGMYNEQCSPTVRNCSFLSNGAFLGGGMLNYSGASPDVTGCTFSDNSAFDSGAGMANYEASPTVTNCAFLTNTTTYGNGGGMFNYQANPIVNDCTFSDNSASDYDGGGIYNEESAPLITGCVFSENQAKHGGGLINLYCSPVVSQCTFANNEAGGGGGLSNIESDLVLTNCTFHGNSAVGAGGLAILCYYASVSVTNCSFFNNSAVEMGGGAVIDGFEDVFITNCLFWGDTSGTATKTIDEIFVFQGAPTVSYSDVQSNPGSPVFPGIGNISANPLWANPGSGDFHLLPNSPCIDAGTYSALSMSYTDFEGDPRLVGNRVDMGVDEWSIWYYDRNHNQRISYSEMVAALTDYMKGDVSYSQMIHALMHYLTGHISPVISECSHINKGLWVETGCPWCGDGYGVSISIEGNTLSMIHKNAVYHSCPEDILVTLEVEGNLLKVTEVDVGDLICLCLSCYDVESTIINLPPGTYKLEYYWYDYESCPGLYDTWFTIGP